MPRGQSCFVEAIPREAIGEIKERLRDSPRDYALFVIGINTGLRESDLIGLRLGDFWNGRNHRTKLHVSQQKTGHIVRHDINESIREAVDRWRRANSTAPLDAFLFYRTRNSIHRTPIFSKHIGTARVKDLVKEWCRSVGLAGNYGGHSLRRSCATLGFLTVAEEHGYGQALIWAKRKLGHTSITSTARYISDSLPQIAVEL